MYKHAVVAVSGYFPPFPCFLVLQSLVCFQEDLFPVVDRTQSEVLGAKKPAISNVVKEADNDAFIESDADEQLIITVRFMAVAKIHSFSISAQNDGICSASFFVLTSL